VVRSVKVSGLFVALLTPFDGEGDLDPAALTGLVEHTLRGGIDGVVALGTTGEFADLTPEERLAVLETTVAAVRGRVPVVAGIGALGTAEACHHAAVAQQAGADAVLSLPPLFWRLDDAELFEHFAAVARATELPVLLYDIPVFAGASLSPELVRRVAEELPSVVGIKLTVTDFRSVSSILTAVKPVRPEFSVTVGFEDLGLPALLAGADGLISGMANFNAPTLRSLVDAVAEDDLAAAARAHADLLRLFPVYFQANPPILALKVLAGALGVPVAPTVRSRHDPEVVRRVQRWVADAAESALAAHVGRGTSS
jgi:4-hydroxy-tetrahydrodipicolinate synthase